MDGICIWKSVFRHIDKKNLSYSSIPIDPDSCSIDTFIILSIVGFLKMYHYTGTSTICPSAHASTTFIVFSRQQQYYTLQPLCLSQFGCWLSTNTLHLLDMEDICPQTPAKYLQKNRQISLGKQIRKLLTGT